MTTIHNDDKKTAIINQCMKYIDGETGVDETDVDIIKQCMKYINEQMTKRGIDDEDHRDVLYQSSASLMCTVKNNKRMWELLTKSIDAYLDDVLERQEEDDDE